MYCVRSVSGGNTSGASELNSSPKRFDQPRRQILRERAVLMTKSDRQATRRRMRRRNHLRGPASQLHAWPSPAPPKPYTLSLLLRWASVATNVNASPELEVCTPPSLSRLDQCAVLVRRGDEFPLACVWQARLAAGARRERTVCAEERHLAHRAFYQQLRDRGHDGSGRPSPAIAPRRTEAPRPHRRPRTPTACRAPPGSAVLHILSCVRTGNSS